MLFSPISMSTIKHQSKIYYSHPDTMRPRVFEMPTTESTRAAWVFLFCELVNYVDWYSIFQFYRYIICIQVVLICHFTNPKFLSNWQSPLSCLYVSANLINILASILFVTIANFIWINWEFLADTKCAIQDVWLTIWPRCVEKNMLRSADKASLAQKSQIDALSLSQWMIFFPEG